MLPIGGNIFVCPYTQDILVCPYFHKISFRSFFYSTTQNIWENHKDKDIQKIAKICACDRVGLLL